MIFINLDNKKKIHSHENTLTVLIIHMLKIILASKLTGVEYINRRSSFVYVKSPTVL